MQGPCGGGGLVAKSCLTLVILWTVAHQAPLSMGFSRQEHWSGLPLPSPVVFPVVIYFCFIDYAKAFDCVDHNKLWEILKEMEYQTTWPASWEICMQVRKQQLQLDMEQQTGSKQEKEYLKAVYVTLLI